MKCSSQGPGVLDPINLQSQSWWVEGAVWQHEASWCFISHHMKSKVPQAIDQGSLHHSAPVASPLEIPPQSSSQCFLWEPQGKARAAGEQRGAGDSGAQWLPEGGHWWWDTSPVPAQCSAWDWSQVQVPALGLGSSAPPLPLRFPVPSVSTTTLRLGHGCFVRQT